MTAHQTDLVEWAMLASVLVTKLHCLPDSCRKDIAAQIARFDYLLARINSGDTSTVSPIGDKSTA